MGEGHLTYGDLTWQEENTPQGSFESAASSEKPLRFNGAVGETGITPRLTEWGIGIKLLHRLCTAKKAESYRHTPPV